MGDDIKSIDITITRGNWGSDWTEIECLEFDEAYRKRLLTSLDRIYPGAVTVMFGDSTEVEVNEGSYLEPEHMDVLDTVREEIAQAYAWACENG